MAAGFARFHAGIIAFFALARTRERAAAGVRHEAHYADQASAIKARLRAGAHPSEIAPAFGVSQSLVYLIKQGRRWAAVT